MSFVKIKYLWGIEWDDKKSPDFASLTWSSTLVDIDGFKGIIDYGIFQWWKNDSDRNLKVLENPEKIDFIILTHAHADHSGRLPMLIKNGFSWPIYTTKLTWLQTKEMLFDNVKIMRAEIEKIKNYNEKYSKLKKDSEFIIRAYEELSSENLSYEERENLNSQVYKKFWEITSTELEKKYFEAKKYLEENKDWKPKNKPELLFDEFDVESTISMFNFIENWEEKIIKENFSLSSPNLTLENLLSLWYQNSTENIHLKIEIYDKIISELEEKIKNTKIILEKNKEIDERNSIFREEIEDAIEYIEDFEKLLSIQDIPKTDIFIKNEKFLKEIWVSDISDIDDVLEKKYKIVYSLNELYALKKLLKISPIDDSENNQDNFLKSIKLILFPAGHIEWSSQVLMTLVSERKRLLETMDFLNIPWFELQNEKHINLLFSWDLWRIKDENLPWSPEKIPYKIDYLQVESTYAWRLHPDRENVERIFFDEIENFNWKILIPAFSIQRTQELLLMFLNEMESRLWDREELKNQNENLQKLKEKYENIEDKNSVFARHILKNINITKNIISDLKKSVVFSEIIVDSPLSIKITDIYKNDEKIWEKYDLLKPENQRKIFWKEVIHFINWKEEQELIHKWKRKNKKEIIISASGMCDWWSVSYHLQKMLPNKNAKVIFVWYCPESTTWWKIKTSDSVVIDWKTFNIDCKISDIPWFSAHADEEEILTYLKNLNFKKWAQISLTHWSENRYEFSKKVSENVNAISNKIKVLVPQLEDEVTIKI